VPIKYLIDQSLFSGSADSLRTAVGGFYNPSGDLSAGSKPADYYGEVPAGTAYDVDTDGGAEGIEEADFEVSAAVSERLSYVLSRTADSLGDTTPIQTTLSKDSIMINKRIPVRLIGNQEHVFSDEHWEKILVGGQWAGSQMEPMIKQNVVFDDQHMESIYPIDAKIVKRLTDLNYSPESYSGFFAVRGDYVQIKPEVNHYIPFYQDYVKKLGSELVIPNAYLMTSIELFGDSIALPVTPYKYSEYNQNYWNQHFINFVSREKSLPEVDYFDINEGELYYDYTAGTPGYESPYAVLLDDMDPSEDYTKEFLSRKYSGMVTKYLPISVPNTPLSSSTVSAIQERMQNIIFDQYSGLGYDSDKEKKTDSVLPSVSDETKTFFPYYINIDFYSERAYKFANNINFHSYSSKFLKLLKEVFLNEIEIQPKTVSYECSYNRTEPSFETAEVTEEYVRETRQLRYVDFLEFLLHSYNNYISETSNCTFIGNPISNPSSLGDLDGFATFQRKAAMDDIGDYRYFNTISTYDVLHATMRMFGYQGTAADPEEHITSLHELFGCSKDFPMSEYLMDPDDDETTPDEYGMSSSDTSGLKAVIAGGTTDAVDENIFGYHEVVAYRVEKIASDASAEELNTRPIQNFWFINTEQREDINLIDTQIKYDTNYTYNIYSYSICVGIKYKTTDLAITKFTSNVADDEDTADEDESELFCLEFFDPNTGEPTAELFGNLDESALLEEMSGVTEDGERIYFLSRASVRTRARYLADFHLHLEPTVRIVENKMYSKTLKALDHPANKLDIEPYQLLDESHTIGYRISYEPFVPREFPQTISAQDVQIKEDYMNAYDFLEGEKISGISKGSSTDWTARQNPNESISRPRYIEVYRLTDKPTKYEDFDNNLYETIDLKLLNQKTATYSDQTNEIEFFNDKIDYNKKYYYMFRMLTEQRMFGDVSEIYEAELVYDGNAPYAIFNTFFKEDLKEKVFVNPSKSVKKIFQIRPNLQQISFDDSNVDYTNRAIDEIENLEVGNLIESHPEESIWTNEFKLRLTSKKTNKKIDLNLTFNLDSD